MQKIILASQSPRRKELLTLANIAFDALTPNTDEQFPPELNFEEAVIYIAKQKALTIAKSYPTEIILAADTVVIIKNTILGKPTNELEAKAMLAALSGNTHQVITGVCIIKNGEEISFADTTLVTFNKLNESQINYYISNYKPFDKAGAYAIQEWIGAIGISKIEGDYYNVMGLPINKVAQILKQ
jgi:septum formation protein